MHFKQFYLGCLAHASYYIRSNGEAAVVDPQRDVDQYLAEAEANGEKIKYVIETHLHADFVGGHSELAKRAGAEIVFGRKAKAAMRHLAVNDGDVLAVGSVNLEILETPGHTPEGISVLVKDSGDESAAAKVLTGDTLFIGDVGRPDLAGGAGFTKEQMASELYDSLHGKLLGLPDETEVYPAHGAGSLCGRNMSKETWSTIGEQRRVNYALQPMTREEFVRMMTAEVPEMPAYFPSSAASNRTGASALSDMAGPRAMSPSEARDFGGIVLDVRSADKYGAAHVPNSLNIGLGGQFASWAGALIPIGTPIILAAESEEQVNEAVMRLARVGIETVEGYLDGGVDAWSAAGFEIVRIPQLDPSAAEEKIKSTANAQFIDVRRPAEFYSSHAAGAQNLTLSNLNNLTDGLNKDRPTFVICQGGYRSSAATSILEGQGFSDLYNVAGGTAAWIDQGLPQQTTAENSAAA
jgi:hydroxyacylglutathione hydrolase